MSASTHELDFTLVIHVSGASRWMTPAAAKRLCNARPLWQIIDKTHSQWNFFVTQTGPKPVILVSEETKLGVIHVKDNAKSK